MSDEAPYTVSVDTDIDREIDRLIGLIVNGDATPEERGKYSELVRQRVRMMQPRPVERHFDRMAKRAFG
jgi:hypothetical protein